MRLIVDELFGRGGEYLERFALADGRGIHSWARSLPIDNEMSCLPHPNLFPLWGHLRRLPTFPNLNSRFFTPLRSVQNDKQSFVILREPKLPKNLVFLRLSEPSSLCKKSRKSLKNDVSKTFLNQLVSDLGVMLNIGERE
jgi:hypothetical protein